jgi:hypothetical protein
MGCAPTKTFASAGSNLPHTPAGAGAIKFFGA